MMLLTYLLNNLLLIYLYFLVIFIIFFFKEVFYNCFCLKTSKIFVFFRGFFLFVFFFTFVMIFRILNFFFYREPFDLKYIYNNNNILILFFVIIFILHFFIKIYSFIIFLFKYNFLKQHFFLLNSKNFRGYKFYTKILFFLTSWNHKILRYLFINNIDILKYKYMIYIFFKYLFDLFLFFFFIIDFFFLNKILILSMGFLPYYGLYKFLFNLNYFLIFSLDLRFDSEISYEIYNNNSDFIKPCNFELIDENIFLKKYIHNILLKSYII